MTLLIILLILILVIVMYSVTTYNTFVRLNEMWKTPWLKSQPDFKLGGIA